MEYISTMFHSRLINDPFGDPGVYVELMYRRDAILFDLGDLHCLTPRNILKVRHIFVSHTHMDHFIGFDHLLRICLGRDKQLALYGPPGFLRNVESKIAAYTWNLIHNYTNDFIIAATEVHTEKKITRRYRLQEAFTPGEERESPFTGTLVDEDFYTVSALPLDHHIPCFGFRLEEKAHVNVKKNALEEMGLPVGQWLLDLKRSILRNEPDLSLIRVWWKEDGRIRERFMPLGELKENLVMITAGERISYITDVVYNPENARLILDFVEGSEILFIESTFLDKEHERALDKCHLTARQAGELARRAGVRRLVLFHFSPKYQGNGDLLVHEAMREFMKDGGAERKAT